MDNMKIAEILSLLEAAGYPSKAVEVEKNNCTLTGITVDISKGKKGGINIMPTIYLDAFDPSLSIPEIVSEIIRIVEANGVPGFNGEELEEITTNFSAARDRILPRIFNKSNETGYLADKVTVPYGEDLVEAFAVNLKTNSDSQGQGSITITKSMAERWGVTAEEIAAAAANNLNNTPVLFKGMSELLSEMMGGEMIDFPVIPDEEEPLFVLSNSDKLYGASFITNDTVMRNIRDRIGEFLIIPSSVHEVICVRADSEAGMMDLTDMITSVNTTSVAPSDILSDHAYRYDFEKKVCVAA